MNQQDYFQGYRDYFWQWEDEGEVIGIPGGSTIAYKAFVTEVLEKLAPQGLPRFGSLLLAVIATNPNGDSDLDTVYALIDHQLGDSDGSRTILKEAFSFLKMLAQVPKNYKEGTRRLLLLQTIFEGCHNSLSAARGKMLVDFCQSVSIAFPGTKPVTFPVYKEDFRVIGLLHSRFPDARTLLEKIARLPELREAPRLEEAAEGEAPPKDFIEELAAHPKTFHAGMLVRRIWSALNIPFHHRLPSSQPLGGVSDLTNKGELDRLLLSEFANEDEVFLSRLANSEALYIHREVPPQHNNLERIILIDVSIKNWGTPKTMAFALLLAIARHPKTDIPCRAFAVGSSCYPLAFDTLDAVIDSLQVLDGCLHPAEGLDTFFRQEAPGKNHEVIFISSAETMRHPALLRTLADWQGILRYWICTDREGTIDVYKRQQQGRRHVQQFRLPLEELWKKEVVPPAGTSLAIPAGKWPILFPGALNPKKVLSTADGEIFQVTAEKHLLRLYDKQGGSKGWQLVYENLPYRQGELEIGRTESGDYIVLLFSLNNRELTLLNLTTGQKRTTWFQDWRSSVYKQFLFHNNRFYFGYLGFPSRHWTFELKEEVVVESFEHLPKDVTDAFRRREEELSGLQKRFTGTAVLKNINSVFINETGNLVFNIHELTLDHQGHVRLQQTRNLKNVFRAIPGAKNEFRFFNGSEVTINRSGVIVLQRPGGPAIYLPSVLEASLGLATDTHFAGNKYYDFTGRFTEMPLRTQQFWERYIDPFIKDIQQDGT